MLLSPKICFNKQPLAIQRTTTICHSFDHKRKVLKGVIKTMIDSNPECLKNAVTEECKLMWDTISDFEIALHKLPTYVDPLEEFCMEFPEADECRMYDV